MGDAVDFNLRDAAVEGFGVDVGQRFALECEGGLGTADVGIADAMAVWSGESFGSSPGVPRKRACGVVVVVDSRRNQRGRSIFELRLEGRVAEGFALAGDSRGVEGANLEFRRGAVGQKLTQRKWGDGVVIGAGAMRDEVANAETDEEPAGDRLRLRR